MEKIAFKSKKGIVLPFVLVIMLAISLLLSMSVLITSSYLKQDENFITNLQEKILEDDKAKESV